MFPACKWDKTPREPQTNDPRPLCPRDVEHADLSQLIFNREDAGEVFQVAIVSLARCFVPWGPQGATEMPDLRSIYDKRIRKHTLGAGQRPAPSASITTILGTLRD